MAVRSSGWIVLALGALGLTQGCVDDGVSMHVICPIEPTISTNMCIWDPMAGTCVVEGVLNVSAASHYQLELNVESGLKPRARDVPPQAEPNGLQVTSAQVELRLPNGDVLGFPAGSNLPNPYNVAVSGYIPPANKEAISVNAITSDYIKGLINSKNMLIYPEIVIALKLKGQTNGAVTVESGEWLWPLRLIQQDYTKAGGVCVNGMFCPNTFGQDDSATVCIDSTISG